MAESREELARGDTSILPVTAAVETGNFVAQLADGRIRRATAERFTGVLRLVVRGHAPWRLHEFPWGVDFLSRFVNGADTRSTLIEHAVNQVGAGDSCILTERQTYTMRTGLHDVRIWTRDNALAGYS